MQSHAWSEDISSSSRNCFLSPPKSYYAKIPFRAQPIKGFIYTIKGSNVYMNMTKQTYDLVYALTLLKVDSCPASSI